MHRGYVPTSGLADGMVRSRATVRAMKTMVMVEVERERAHATQVELALASSFFNSTTKPCYIFLESIRGLGGWVTSLPPFTLYSSFLVYTNNIPRHLYNQISSSDVDVKTLWLRDEPTN